jgi:hypothetical protein
MARTRIAAFTALLLGLAGPSHALFDHGNVGLPTGHPGVFDPTDPGDPPPPPPPLPPLGITGFGLQYVDVVARAPIGRTSQLFKQEEGGSYVPFRSLVAGTETQIHDDYLHVGRGYCYRMEITGGSGPDETHTRCQTTDWRVGFENIAITPADSTRVLHLFDWRDTEPLAQGTEASPALYHMNLLIEAGDPLAEQGFRSMGMHVQSAPIFHQELVAWNDAQSMAQDCAVGPVAEPPVVVAQAHARTVNGAVNAAANVADLENAGIFDPTVGGSMSGGCRIAGRWYFAAVPGSVYNEIRANMLDKIAAGEEPSIKALVFRKVPVAAALAPGVSRHVLNYTFLGEQGFEFNAISRCWEEDGTRYCSTQSHLIGWIFRKVAYWVVEFVDEAIECVRSAIGRIKRLVKGELTLSIQFRLLNTDPGFGKDEVMRSGWSGEELKLAGVEVEVRQGLAGFYEKTQADGSVSLKVAKNSDTKVCIKLENDAVEITEFLIETTKCVKGLGSLSSATSVVIDVREDYVNALAAMTDAKAWHDAVTGRDMPKLTVLVGGNAMLLSPTGRSFAPCMGRVPSLIGVATDALYLANPAALIIGASIEFLYAVDIVLLPSDDGSRGVPVHEYGHAVMCDMLLDQGFDAFEIAWTQVIKQSAGQGADDEASYINEGFADFFTGQVMGGTNYFPTSGSTKSESVNYCDAGAECLERNYRSTDQSDLGTNGPAFRAQVRRVASLLQDAFDGQDAPDTTNDASHWATGTPFTSANAYDSDQSDEAVVLGGRDLIKMFQHWDDRGTLIDENNFLGGLADLAKANGFSDPDVCAMFELHDASASCPSFAARRAWLDWMGPVSGGTLAQLALAPAPGAPSGPAGGVAFMAAVANPEPEPEDACADCSRVVVLEGVQKVAVQKAGKSLRDTAFAFRFGGGAFESVDPLGQRLLGAWDARDASGKKLRLHPGDGATDAIEALLAQSAQELGIDPGTLTLTGPAKIELRLAKGGAIVGKITLAFEVSVDGQVRKGSYVAKLRGTEA